MKAESLIKCRWLYIVSIIIITVITLTVYSFIDSVPDETVLTLGFVDALTAKDGSDGRISAAFEEKGIPTRTVFVSRGQTDSLAQADPSNSPIDVLYKTLIREGADAVIISRTNLLLMEQNGYIAPLPEEADCPRAGNGIVIDGIDFTGAGDIFCGLSETDENDFCMAVLTDAVNAAEARQALVAVAELVKESNAQNSK